MRCHCTGMRVAAVDRAEQRAADRGVGIRVAAGADGGDDAGLEVRGVQQLEEGVLQRDQHPALLRQEVRRGASAAASSACSTAGLTRRAAPFEGERVASGVRIEAAADRRRHA